MSLSPEENSKNTMSAKNMVFVKSDAKAFVTTPQNLVHYFFVNLCFQLQTV